MTKTKSPPNQTSRKMKKRITRMASNWSANRDLLTGDLGSHSQHFDESPIEQLLRHVLDAMMRCETPTIANIAAEAEICEECCQTIMQLAEDLGFVVWQPATNYAAAAHV